MQISVKAISEVNVKAPKKFVPMPAEKVVKALQKHGVDIDIGDVNKVYVGKVVDEKTIYEFIRAKDKEFVLVETPEPKQRRFRSIRTKFIYEYVTKNASKDKPVTIREIWEEAKKAGINIPRPQVYRTIIDHAMFERTNERRGTIYVYGWKR